MKISQIKIDAIHMKSQKSRFIFILLVSFLVTACSNEMGELQAYTEEVKNRTYAGIEPLPEIKPYRTFQYETSNKRDPFDDSIFRPLVLKERTGKKPTNSISPDLNRVPEYLESFPLDTLRMVGTMSQNEELWALVKTPDNTIQRVAGGSYLGQNNGRIIDISSGGIELVEIIPDGFGGWREREGNIALSE